MSTFVAATNFANVLNVDSIHQRAHATTTEHLQCTAWRAVVVDSVVTVEYNQHGSTIHINANGESDQSEADFEMSGQIKQTGDGAGNTQPADQLISTLTGISCIVVNAK